jgi:hypothetical protein
MVEVDPLSAVIAFAGVLLAFLAGGSYINRKRAGKMANNLKPAFLSLGSAKITWIGRGVFRYDVEKPKEPFERVAAMTQLLPRDLPFSWAAAAIMGKKDMMTFRANLRSPPRVEFEAFVDEGYVGRRMREALESTDWQTLRLPAGEIVVAAARRDLAIVRNQLAPFEERLTSIWRLSASKVEPHITANFDPSGPPDLQEARVRTLREIALSLVSEQV